MRTRQKILLSLLEAFGGKLSNTEMMKYLFILSQSQKEQSYHFVPYKFGCFSFEAYADKRKLMEKGVLCHEEFWSLADKELDIDSSLKYEDRVAVWNTKKEFGDLHGNDLIRFIYNKYPYYAINSEIRDEVMSPKECTEIEKFRPVNNATVLYSLGYEGKSLEEYINILIQKDIKLLCDVRRNPLSRKYGFSKNSLKNAVESIGIDYLHISELGIASADRQSLNSHYDYEKLFNVYEKEIRASKIEYCEALYEQLLKYSRVALMCFEKDPDYCHRKRITSILREIHNNLPRVEHLQ